MGKTVTFHSKYHDLKIEDYLLLESVVKSGCAENGAAAEGYAAALRADPAG
jgi:hypothetical protein